MDKLMRSDPPVNGELIRQDPERARQLLRNQGLPEGEVERIIQSATQRGED